MKYTWLEWFFLEIRITDLISYEIFHGLKNNGQIGTIIKLCNDRGIHLKLREKRMLIAMFEKKERLFYNKETRCSIRFKRYRSAINKMRYIIGFEYENLNENTFKYYTKALKFMGLPLTNAEKRAVKTVLKSEKPRC